MGRILAIDYGTKRTGIAVTRQGTSRSVSLGAYIYALNQLDNR